MDMPHASVMQPTSSSPLLRDELFRRIGRNVVNFQCLEASLRSLIPSMGWDGTPTEIVATVNEVSRKHKKSSLGNLSDAFFERVSASKQNETPMEDDPPIVGSIRYSLQFETTPEQRAEQRQALRRLVMERNRLIHRQFLEVDLNSAEQCDALAKVLDEQNERLRSQILHLRALRQAHQSALEEFRNFLQSDEFMSVLRGELDDT